MLQHWFPTEMQFLTMCLKHWTVACTLLLLSLLNKGSLCGKSPTLCPVTLTTTNTIFPLCSPRISSPNSTPSQASVWTLLFVAPVIPAAPVNQQHQDLQKEFASSRDVLRKNVKASDVLVAVSLMYAFIPGGEGRRNHRHEKIPVKPHYPIKHQSSIIPTFSFGKSVKKGKTV